MCLLAILRVDPAENLAKYKRLLCVLFIHSCIVHEHITKDVQGQGPSKIVPSLSVCFFDVYRPSLQFPSINYGQNESQKHLNCL